MSDKLEVRDGLLYTRDHEWTSSKAEGMEVGITAYAVDQLGDITLVNLDLKVGDAVVAGKAFGTIESVKTLSDLFSPVGGKIVKINTDLETKPELVNEDCYGKAWMVVIEAADDKAVDQLLDEKAYEAHVKASS